jgi:hypothetical protein
VTAFTHYHCEQLQQESAGENVGLRDIWNDKTLRRPIGIAMLVNLASVGTGIVAIFSYVSAFVHCTSILFYICTRTLTHKRMLITYFVHRYSSTMFAEARLGGDDQAAQITAAQYASIAMSVFNTAGAFVANALIDRVGRRQLMMVYHECVDVFLMCRTGWPHWLYGVQCNIHVVCTIKRTISCAVVGNYCYVSNVCSCDTIQRWSWCNFMVYLVFLTRVVRLHNSAKIF